MVPGPARIANGLVRMMASILSGNYLVIISVAFLCLFPVYSGYFSLKYDNIAFDLPMHYFMGEQIAKGELPVWFHTWNMGFPLQSVFCWGVFSSIFLFFSGLNAPDASILHAELVFFIALAGISFYKLMKYFAPLNRDLACFLACAYMLSGFTFGSSQWMFYLSGMALLPLCIYFLLQLIKEKSLKYVLLFPVSYLVFFTNTHVFLSITGSYILAAIFIFRVWMVYRENRVAGINPQKVWYRTAASILFLVLLCLPPVFYSIELLPFLNRSTPITVDEVVFQSDFMHPGGLITLFLPQAALKWQIENTEGMMQSVYTGLLTPLLYLLAIKRSKPKFDAANKLLAGGALFFLLLSFGHYLPLRELMNYLPGFAYFRHPGLFRLLFIGFMLVFIGRNVSGNLRDSLFSMDAGRMLRVYVPVVLVIILVSIGIGAVGLTGAWKGSVVETIKQADTGSLLFAGGILQLFILGAVFMAYHRRPGLLAPLLIFDLMVNGLFCLPFNTVSSHSINHLVSILSPVAGNPIQTESPSNVKSFFIEPNGTQWEHYNCCEKKISADVDIYNPLTGAGINTFLRDTTRKKTIGGQPVIFLSGVDSGSNKNLFVVQQQEPTLLSARALESAAGTLVVQQMNFPGWKIFKNNLEIPVLDNTKTPFVSADITLSKGDIITAKYRKPSLAIWAWLLNGVVLITLLGGLLYKFVSRLMPFIC